MSNLTLRGNPAGTGTFTLESPNSNTSRTLTLPDASTTLVGTDATQTLTNKTLNGGALTLMTAQASTSGANIDFTGIPSWAKRITVIFSGVSSTGTVPIFIQLGTSGGIEGTGYVGGVATIQGTNATATTSSTTGFLLLFAAVAAGTFSGQATLSLITGNTWVVSSILGQGNNGLAHFGHGTKTTSGALTQVRVSVAGDTFDAGTINVMYEG